MRVSYDYGLLLIQIGHQRFQLFIAQILAVTVGSQLDAVCTKNFQGIFRFLQSFVHIRQRQGGAEQESSRMERLQPGGLFVELSADGGRFFRVSEIRLRCRHRDNGSEDTGIFHKFQMSFHAP